MKRTNQFLRLVSLAGCCFLAVVPLSAQQPNSGSCMVAVVDLTKVFEAHSGFKVSMEAVEQQIKTAELDLQTQQKQLTARNAELSQLNPSSVQYRELESKLAQQLADLKVKTRQTKKEFMQREAVQYHAAYQDILAAVRRVAEKYDIRLVLRFDAAAIDPQSPQSVAMGMARSVVVQRNLDITHLVTKELQLSLAQKPNQGPAPRR
jgi:Skp family chaperone for outer membrane proteins